MNVGYKICYIQLVLVFIRCLLFKFVVLKYCTQFTVLNNQIQTNMNPTPPQFSRFWHFVWLLFMQPITLYSRLNACGIKKPDAPLLNLKYWFAKDKIRTIKRQYLKQMLLILVS